MAVLSKASELPEDLLAGAQGLDAEVLLELCVADVEEVLAREHVLLELLDGLLRRGAQVDGPDPGDDGGGAPQLEGRGEAVGGGVCGGGGAAEGQHGARGDAVVGEEGVLGQHGVAEQQLVGAVGDLEAAHNLLNRFTNGCV